MLVGLLGLVLDVSVAIGGCLGFSLKLSTMPTIVSPFFLLIANLHWRFFVNLFDCWLNYSLFKIIKQGYLSPIFRMNRKS